MKKLLLTIVVLSGAAAAICHYKGIKPADIRDWIDEHTGALQNKTPAQAAGTVASGAAELAGEITDAISDALPDEETIDSIPGKLAELRKRLADREKAIRTANAKLSPYIERAVQLKRKYDAAMAEADALRKRYGDTDPRVVKAAQNLSTLGMELTKASDRHSNWKKANQARLKDPATDKECIELRREIKELEQSGF